MKRDRGMDLGLNGLAELFMDNTEREYNVLPKIFQIPIEMIDEFPDHPFRVRLDEDMEQLVESVKERGVITPVTLRKKEDGRYETVSGHRRVKASELAGLETVPAEVKELSKDEAIILMVDSNLQRSTILPSEKAFSYKMRLDAMKRLPGRPSKDNMGPVVQNYSRDALGETTGESGRQISRYIRLTELVPEILEMVDEGKIAMRPAVELSYLNVREQNALVEAMEFADATPSHAQAIKLREFSKKGSLTPEVIESIMCEEKPNQKEKINLNYKQARKFIPDSVPYEKTADYIFKALEYYQHHLERVRANRDSR